jgi:hypothetical protein
VSKPSPFGRTAILIALLAVLIAHPNDGASARDDPVAPPAQATVVRVYYTNSGEKNKLLISFKAQLLETNYEDGYHLMQLTEREAQQLSRAGFRVQADPGYRPPPSPIELGAADQPGGIPGYPCYRTVEETVSSAQRIAQDYPRLAVWEDIGDSWEKTAGMGGHDIGVLRLTNRDIPGPKPSLLLIAALHGREYATAELVTRFAETLVEGYGADADVTWILDHQQVHLVLIANPDGRKLADEGQQWRKNTNDAYCRQDSPRRGADLNRNFDYMWNCCGGSSDYQCAGNYHGRSAASEPETIALQRYMAAIFADQRGPSPRDRAPTDTVGLLLDVHSYGELVLWPWGFSDAGAPNSDQLETLGRKLAYWNGYTPTQSMGLYPTDGSCSDYGYGQFGVAAYTLELGTQFFQPCFDFESTILPGNLPTLLYAAKAARAPYVIPSGPESTRLSVSGIEVAVGTPVTLSVTIDDTRYQYEDGVEPGQEIVGAQWCADAPPWADGASATPMAAADGAWDSSVEQAEAIVDTTGWHLGRHTLYVRGQDADGNWGATSAIYLTLLERPNQAPVAAFIHQCQELSCQLDGSASYDRDGRIATHAWDLGDGSTSSGATTTHGYAATGLYSVTLTVTDDDGASASLTQDVTVSATARIYLPYVVSGTDAR